MDDCESLKENMQKSEMRKHEEDERAWKESPETHNNDLKRHTPIRRPPIPRYQSIFLGLCYACNNYGHKAIDCRVYARNRNTWRRNRYENSRYQVEGNCVRKSHVAPDRNYNRIGALNYEIECYRCHNFGHIARNYRSRFTGSSNQSKENKQAPKQHTSWKRKKEYLQIEECGIALTTQNSRSYWCVDSGCSRNMTGNKNTFQTLQENDKTVTFGNENSSKILGKGTISLGNKDASTKNVLLIENMKHNLLSISQKCDQGHVLIVTSKYCKIRKEGLGKLVATSSITPNNIYILDEIKNEKCYLGREDES